MTYKNSLRLHLAVTILAILLPVFISLLCHFGPEIRHKMEIAKAEVRDDITTYCEKNN